MSLPLAPAGKLLHGSRPGAVRLAAAVGQLEKRGIRVVVIRSPAWIARESSGVQTTMRRRVNGELAESFISVGSRLTPLREILGTAPAA